MSSHAVIFATMTYLPGPPNVDLFRASWSSLDGSWGSLKGSWGVLVKESIEHFDIKVGCVIMWTWTFFWGWLSLRYPALRLERCGAATRDNLHSPKVRRGQMCMWMEDSLKTAAGIDMSHGPHYWQPPYTHSYQPAKKTYCIQQPQTKLCLVSMEFLTAWIGRNMHGPTEPACLCLKAEF